MVLQSFNVNETQHEKNIGIINNRFFNRKVPLYPKTEKYMLLSK